MPPKPMDKPKLAARDIDDESAKPRLKSKDDQTAKPDSDNDDDETEMPPPKSGKSKKSLKSKNKKKDDPSPRHQTSGKRKSTYQTKTESEDAPPPPENSDDISPAMKMLLLASDHVTPTKVKFPAISEFVPDMHAFYAALYALQDQIASNEYFYRITPEYFSLATSIYYGVLMTFHICRTRTHLNIASPDEKIFALSFEKEFKLECLPIAGPLAGFFETLGYIRPLETYGYVCPKLPALAANKTAGNLDLNQVGSVRYPAIPAMLLMYLDFFDHNAMYAHPTENVYWPANFNKLNIRAANAPEYTRLIHTPGWRSPVALAITQFDVNLRNLLRKSPMPPNPTALALNSPATFCCMPSGGNHSWFRRFIDIAAAEASFAEGITNMSNITVSATPGMLTETLTDVKHTAQTYPEKAKPTFPSPDDTLTLNKLTGLARFGNDTDFNDGLSTSFLLRYTAIDEPSHSPDTSGPWFDNTLENTAAAPPVYNTSLPYIKENWYVTNPTTAFPNIVTKTMHPLDGIRRS